MGRGIMRRRTGLAKRQDATIARLGELPSSPRRSLGEEGEVMVARLRWAVLSLAGLAAGCAMPSMPNLPKDAAFQIQTQYWFAEPNGHVEVEAGSAPATGSNAHLEHRLGIEEDEQILWSGHLAFGDHRIGVEYLPLSFGGSETTSRNFVFQGTPFPAGDNISTDFDLETWVLKWDYAVEKQKRTADAFRIGLGAWWWTLDQHVVGKLSGGDESREFSHIYPGVHTLITMEIGEDAILDHSGAIAGTSANRRLYDWSATVGYPVSDYFVIGGGYRWMIWDFNETNNDGDFDFKGPFGSATIRF
jgi:hypothetical protein